MIVSTALMCLALNVYHESRGEIIPGQYAVALVTMNRAKGDEGKICREVFKPSQFSWANNKAARHKGGWQIYQGLRPKDAHAWQLAQRVAAWTLAGKMPDITNGATHYHTHKVRPHWSREVKPVKKIGGHRFFVIRRKSGVTG